jgi:hypothetical protein
MRPQMGSGVDALEAGGADWINVVEENQGRGTQQDPTTMRLGMVAWTGSATTRRSTGATVSSRLEQHPAVRHRRAQRDGLAVGSW